MAFNKKSQKRFSSPASPKPKMLKPETKAALKGKTLNKAMKVPAGQACTMEDLMHAG